MDEGQQESGPLRVGMIWGGIGGVAAFAASLPVPHLGGLLAAIVIGVVCGRRAVSPGEENAARNGLVSGLLAAPVLALGAAAGTMLTAQQIGMEEFATVMNDVADFSVTGQEAWQYFLAGVALMAVLQAAVLILTAVLAANRTAGKKGNGSGEDNS